MLSQIRPAIVSTVLFTLLLGVGYPLAVTGVAKLAFPAQAGGSLIRDAKGQVIGSALIAQPFAKDEYLHPRPSAAGMGYDASNSGGLQLWPAEPGPGQARRRRRRRPARLHRPIRRSPTTPSPPRARAWTPTSRRPTPCCRSTASPRPAAPPATRCAR